MMIRMVLAIAFIAGSIVVSDTAEAGRRHHRHVRAVRHVHGRHVYRPVHVHHVRRPAVAVYHSYRVAPIVVPAYRAYHARPVVIYSDPYHY